MGKWAWVTMGWKAAGRIFLLMSCGQRVLAEGGGMWVEGMERGEMGRGT